MIGKEGKDEESICIQDYPIVPRGSVALDLFGMFNLCLPAGAATKTPKILKIY